MEDPQFTATCQPAIGKFAKRAAQENGAPNALRFLRQAGLSDAWNIVTFSDFSEVCFHRWSGLDFPAT